MKRPLTRKDRSLVQRPLLTAALVGSAYAMALSVASGGHPWLGWLALLPLFRAIQVLPASSASLAGGLWGAGLFLFGVTVVPTGISATLGSALLLTAIPTVYAYLGARLTRRIGFNAFVLGTMWMLVELGLQPLALRNGLLARTQGGGALIDVVGRLFGYVLVAFLLAFTGASVLQIASLFRLRLPRLEFALGADEPFGWLWTVLPSISAVTVAGPAAPRGPPISAA